MRRKPYEPRGWAGVATALVVIMVLAQGALAQPEIGVLSMPGGGGTVTDGVHTLDMSIGQPFAGTTTEGVFETQIGFWYLTGGRVVTGVDGELPPPVHTEMQQNSPNPFNPMTTIRYAVGAPGRVSLTIYDLQGRVVGTLVDAPQEVGEYELVFRPRGLASGTYLYRLVTPDGVVNRRMVLLK